MCIHVDTANKEGSLCSKTWKRRCVATGGGANGAGGDNPHINEGMLGSVWKMSDYR